MKRWHAETAWLGRSARNVLVEVDGDTIATVSVDVPPPPDATRITGALIPGLVNAHSHAFHRALRGRTHRAGGDFWSWRQHMFAIAERLDPESYRELARAVYAEMALAGITTVGEFHYVHHQPDGTPYDDEAAMSHALIEAASDAGIRITLLDVCYLRGGMRGEPLEGPQRRFGDRDVEAWTDRAARSGSGPANRYGVAVHSVRAVDPRSIAEVAKWASAAEVPLHVHVSEQRREVEECMSLTGMSPVESLADAGALGARTTAVHATHVSGLDVELLGTSRTGVCMCPTTERDLADGIGPAAPLVEAGSSLSLGSDSHAFIDLFEEARAVELDERLARERRGLHDPDRLLDAATRGGATALGWDAGAIEPGARADFISVDLEGPRLAGTDPADLAAHLVFGATAADVTDVVVGGEAIVADRRHLKIPDVGAALASAIGRFR